MKTNATIGSLVFSIAGLSGLLLDFCPASAHAQMFVPRPAGRYEMYVPGGNRVPYVIQRNSGYYYYYDAINRPFGFTPEPIWHAMFPGIRARIAAEVRAFGVPGEAGRELAGWQEYYRTHAREDTSKDK